jgi:hypothetical protein
MREFYFPLSGTYMSNVLSGFPTAQKTPRRGPKTLEQSHIRNRTQPRLYRLDRGQNSHPLKLQLRNRIIE